MRTATYVFERPRGVDDGSDLALRVQLQQTTHGGAHVHGTTGPLLEGEPPQLEAGHRLVLVVQLDRRDFVHLPPLDGNRANVNVWNNSTNTISTTTV